MRSKVLSFELVRNDNGFMLWSVRGTGRFRCETMRTCPYHNISDFSLRRIVRLFCKADFVRTYILGRSLGVEGYFSDKTIL